MPKEFEKSRRCARCDIDWPLGNEYRSCPRCGGETFLGIFDPLTYDEARELKNKLSCEREAHARAEQRMDEAFEQSWTREHGIDLSRTADPRDGAPVCEL